MLLYYPKNLRRRAVRSAVSFLFRLLHIQKACMAPMGLIVRLTFFEYLDVTVHCLLTLDGLHFTKEVICFHIISIAILLS